LQLQREEEGRVSNNNNNQSNQSNTSFDPPPSSSTVAQEKYGEGRKGISSDDFFGKVFLYLIELYDFI